jgi:Regulator of ribonuclease activity B
LRAEGFAVAYERDDEGEYVLQAVRRDPVAAPEVHAVTWLVRQTVEQYGGVYDGWGCTVQSRDFVDS